MPNNKDVRRRRRVLIVDDHPVVTETLSALIDRQNDLEVCGIACDATEALKLIETEVPEAAIIDISLNGADGIELIKAAATQRRRLPTLVLSRHEEAIYGERALRAGARGYLTKRQALDQVLEALRRILDGEIYFSEEFKTRLLVTASKRSLDERPIDRLSDRELEVFRLVGHGHTARQIAIQLGLSVSTVESHRRNVRRKFDLESSRDLVLHAVRWWDRQTA